jgi:cytochrome b6-f complex iron-sulfur subunit
MWMLYTGFLGIFGAAMGRFFFPNVLYEPPTTFKIGRPSDFLPDSVDTRFKSSNQIWVVRDDLGVYVLKAVCTHLGCTPSWLQAEEKYKCPCHGSGFRMNGMNFEGPAPRPLERYKVALADDGQIVVDSSKVFLQPNEWTNAEAYIPA